jgi:hypothetical protein
MHPSLVTNPFCSLGEARARLSLILIGRELQPCSSKTVST